jgi:hypothetical protein
VSVKVPKEGGAEAFKAWKAAGIDVIELGVPPLIQMKKKCKPQPGRDR